MEHSHPSCSGKSLLFMLYTYPNASQDVIEDEDFEDPNWDPQVEWLEDDSPYPEVRSAVSNADDPDMECGTARAWFMGLLCAIVISGLNQFFFFRWPSVQIGSLVAQLIAFPFGRALARITPRWKIFGVSLNPGPFTIKEHVLVTIMSTVGAASAYATDITAVQRVFYNREEFSLGYQWMVVMSTQLIGLSIGGVSRRFLVSPPSMIYCTLFNTLHSQQYQGIGGRGGMSRERFFVYAFVISGVWYLLPGYLFTALSTFTWVCWIKPDNVVINQLFGYEYGLGMSLITFDWSQIAYIGSPLATPWWAQANLAVGFVAFFWVLSPIIYYTNTWNSEYMPIMSREAYDNTGQHYQVKRILGPDHTFDMERYKAYSPLFLSTTFAISYGLSFAAISSTFVHALLYLRKQIWSQCRRTLAEQPDIHARLMTRYREVPAWWYGVIFVVMFAFGVVSIELWPTQMPVWAFVLALVIAYIYVIPIGMIQAITNQQIGLNVITELVIGYALPGKPVAMMLFKTWGFMTMSQGLQFASDFKLGHYMKIPPRTMFWCQVVATVIAGTTQIGVQTWMFSHILLLYFFLIGAIAPLIPWLINKKWPNNYINYINIPLIFGGTGDIPPANAVNYVPWTIVGFIFQYVIRRNHFSWWTKYNYVLSAALDSGVAVSTVIIFFTLQYPENGRIGQDTIQKWWGNTVYMYTADYLGVPLRQVKDGLFYGPKIW
ncbi:hypothetical protein HWV62_21206 [Athelia sp. TMB]|nr:hypothetical protein HWV62_21206 [Athelia sp. TMB]